MRVRLTNINRVSAFILAISKRMSTETALLVHVAERALAASAGKVYVCMPRGVDVIESDFSLVCLL